jgi:hypothetical protein
VRNAGWKGINILDFFKIFGEPLAEFGTEIVSLKSIDDVCFQKINLASNVVSFPVKP